MTNTYIMVIIVNVLIFMLVGTLLFDGELGEADNNQDDCMRFG